MESNETVKRSSSSMELLVTSAPTMVDTSTAGLRPPGSPIIASSLTTKFLKYMMKIPRGPHRGKITTDRPDNAANTADTQGEQPESEMEDDTSVTVETGNVSIPSQVPTNWHLLLHNILLFDREYNAPILEKLEAPPADPNANPYPACSRQATWSHLASHLSITSQTLAQHAQNRELDDISEISD